MKKKILKTVIPPVMILWNLSFFIYCIHCTGPKFTIRAEILIFFSQKKDSTPGPKQPPYLELPKDRIWGTFDPIFQIRLRLHFFAFFLIFVQFLVFLCILVYSCISLYCRDRSRGSNYLVASLSKYIAQTFLHRPHLLYRSVFSISTLYRSIFSTSMLYVFILNL